MWLNLILTKPHLHQFHYYTVCKISWGPNTHCCLLRESSEWVLPHQYDGWGAVSLSSFPILDNYGSWSEPKLPLLGVDTPTLIPVPYLGPMGPGYSLSHSARTHIVKSSWVGSMNSGKSWLCWPTVKFPSHLYMAESWCVHLHIHMYVWNCAISPERLPLSTLLTGSLSNCLFCLVRSTAQASWGGRIILFISSMIMSAPLLVWAQADSSALLLFGGHSDLTQQLGDTVQKNSQISSMLATT